MMMLQGFQAIPTLEKSADNFSVPVSDPMPLSVLGRERLPDPAGWTVALINRKQLLKT